MSKQYLTPEESKQFGEDIREAFYQWHLERDSPSLTLIIRSIDD